MYADDYRQMMVAKYGEDGYQLRELRECILERLPLRDDFTRDDLAMLLNRLIGDVEIMNKTARNISILIAPKTLNPETGANRNEL